MHPERFILQVAAKHQVPLQSPGAVVRAERYERDASFPPEHPDAWRVVRERGTVNLGHCLPLSPAGLSLLRTLILEMGSSLGGTRPEAWTPEQRAVWCLTPWRISAEDLAEICATAAVVAAGLATPERALARHRSGVPLDDAYHRDRPHLGCDAPPVAEHDRQLVRLRLVNEIAFAEPYGTTGWMVRWAFFRPGRGHPHLRFTTTVTWLRQTLDILAAWAAARVRTAARQYRDDFFRTIDPQTCPVPDSKFEFWVYGYGEVADPVIEARVAEQARAFPRKAINHVRVSLAGNAEPLYEALREAGTAALRWPWVIRVLDGWRAAIEEAGHPNSELARDRMEGVSAALANIRGRGAIARPERTANIREAADLLCAHLVVWLRDKNASVPPRLLEIGDAAHDDWNKRIAHRRTRHRYKRLDLAAIVDARRMVKVPGQAVRVAREVVAAAFGVTVERVDRIMVGHGQKRSRRGIRNRR